MGQHVTRRDLALTAWGSSFTLPAGTPVTLIKGADGLKGDLWAVRDARTLINLTGNSHDPIYRYCWIDAAEVVERGA